MAHIGAWIIWRGIETRNLSLYRVHVGRCVCYGWRVCVCGRGGVQDQGGADTSASNTACCELGHATSTWIGWPRVASVFSSWINNLKFENSAVA